MSDLRKSTWTRRFLVGSAGGLAASALLIGGAFAAGQQPDGVNPAPVAPQQGAPASFADIVARVAPAVVSVDVEGDAHPSAQAYANPQQDPFGPNGPFGDLRRFFGPQFGGQFRGQATPQPMRGTASGFFISADGYIVTNNHVVDGADRIKVRTKDGRTLKATLVGRDPATDLAVLKVEGHDYPFVNFEDRSKPRVGDWVVAVGNPFNLGGTATAGIVSALSRPNVSGSGYVDYMQIDAPINRGNSGGPTFDLYGRVVGVNTAIFSPSGGGSVGIGFDIPADVADSVSRQLIAGGKVVRGYIGASVQDVTPEIAESLGVPARKGELVADVVPGGPAQRSGLRSGDIVMQADGAPIQSAGDLTRRVALARPGASLSLDIQRDGHRQTLRLKTDQRPSEQQLAQNGPTSGGGGAGEASLGLSVAPRQGGGLDVAQVQPGSEAARKGIRRGDVIEQVSGRPANSAQDVRAAVSSARAAGRKSVLMKFARGGRHLFLALNLPAPQG
jgi:serine protease Do